MNIVLNEIEARVSRALVEKDITTPDYYPLSLNALVNACNQKNNREPVMNLVESGIRDALNGLHEHRLAGPVSGADSRVTKYEHRLQETFNFSRGETAVLPALPGISLIVRPRLICYLADGQRPLLRTGGLIPKVVQKCPSPADHGPSCRHSLHPPSWSGKMGTRRRGCRLESPELRAPAPGSRAGPPVPQPARPSGTENTYNYAESFRDEAHLEAILHEAEEMVNRALES